MDDPNKIWGRRVATALLLLGITIIVLILDKVTGCSTQTKTKTIVGPPAATVTVVETATRTDTGTGTGTGDRRPCDDVTTFDELQPVLAQVCAGCHQGIDVVDRARTWFANIDNRIHRPVGAPGHMPVGGELSDTQLALFEAWESDGFLKSEECEARGGSQPEPPAFVSLVQLETAMLADASSQNEVDQPDVRYLIFTDRINAGAAASDLAVWQAAAAKASSSVSPERGLFPPVEIAPGILRVNIRDLGIDGQAWKLIENASLLQLESFTTAGLNLKNVTKARLPWFHVAEFNDTVLRNATVYHALLKLPNTVDALRLLLGVDFSGDLKNRKALLIGFNGSQLSPAANRLMFRFDADANNGYFWGTGDTGPIVNADQNIFANPGILQAGTRANLRVAAGEFLFTLPNGLMGSYLADAAGRRLDFADPNVVHDFTSNPVAPIIRNAISCFRCHAGGLLTHADEVRASILGGGSQVGADDAQILLKLYRGEPEISRAFAADNGAFCSAMRRIGVDCTQPDPISRVSDKFLGDLTLKDVAGLVSIPADEFAVLLNLSVDGKAEAGQLLAPGGTISHDQLVQVLPILKRDLRLLQNPL